MSALGHWPWSFTALAIAVSAVHGYRGFVLPWTLARRRQQQLPWAMRRWPDREIVLARCVQSGLLHAMCSFAGFAALLGGIRLWRSPIDVAPSPTVLAACLLVIGVIGAAGHLPAVFHVGRWPASR
jgi:hypothetical protein